jgi:prepilin-type N-terminal cleavage/methylation domain-containing protein
MKRKSGFTLVEMIITLAITVIILGITTSMFIAGNKIFNDSDVKSTLQIEGQAIQEKISNIGMQAIEVESVEVDSVVIKSYIKDDDVPRYFKIGKDETDEKNFIISQCTDVDCNIVENIQNISENLESLTIHYDDENKLIKFDIELSKQKGFSDVVYPINFKVTFRNNGNQN